MKAMRRYGLLLFVFYSGMVVGAKGLDVSLLIGVPLFVLWWMARDEKAYKRSIYRNNRKRA